MRKKPTKCPANKAEVKMIDKNKIKVVKRIEAATLSSQSRKIKVVSPRVAARVMVSNVTEWVTDLKQRKTLETKAAFDLLFAANQRPSES